MEPRTLLPPNANHANPANPAHSKMQGHPSTVDHSRLLLPPKDPPDRLLPRLLLRHILPPLPLPPLIPTLSPNALPHSPTPPSPRTKPPPFFFFIFPIHPRKRISQKN